MDSTLARKVELYVLLQYKSFLKRTLSFSDNICRCNFTVSKGWGGKLYVLEHDVVEMKPADLRGVNVLDLYYISPVDYVILTEAQYADYKYATESLGY